MQGLRKHRTHYFVQVPRETIRDERLSWKARGILAFLLDHPEGWIVKAEQLADEGPDGRDAVLSGLRELRAAGYYRLERRRMLDGTFAMGTSISDTAQPDWAAESEEFGSGPVTLQQQQDGSFLVKRMDGRLVPDGFETTEVGSPGSGESGPGEPVSPPSTGVGFSELGPRYAPIKKVEKEGSNTPPLPPTPPGAQQPRPEQTPLALVVDTPHPETPGSADRRSTARDEAQDEMFETFWQKYPRKVGKGQARKAWKAALKKTKGEAIPILTGLDAHTANWTANQTDPQYIPHPSTWLNGERWLDVVHSPQQINDNPWESLPTGTQYMQSIGLA